VLLNEGEWSDWVRIEFHSEIPGSNALGLLGAPTSIHGMARMFLKQVHPKLELYVSPINIDPLDPVNPISLPSNFAPQLAQRYGPFYTTGIPEDTKALTNGALTEDQFLAQSELVVSERVRQYRGALQDFDRGCMFFYFGATDLVQHMFWRDRDPQHPGRVPEEVERYEKVVEEIYLGIDRQVGEAMAALDPEDTLIVMSDHGFTSFRRGFNLNTWLMDNGYIKLINPAIQGRSLLFGNTDWSDTRAYGLGLNGLYLNLQGRERHGIVAAKTERRVIEEIREKLMEVRDEDGSQVIETVAVVSEMFPGADPKIAPDLIVGYADGYRSSWATVLGQMPKTMIEDNLDRWSGTHLTAPEVVPGMFVSNRKVVADNPSISDIAPTILRDFGLEIPSQMTGRPLFG
jgi:predicted AlkP superfamily phosphohydrolase/phosphomutase